MKPLIIIPTYNEKENLEAIVNEVLLQLPQATILIIDDNSPDGTGAIADELCQQRLGRQVQVMHRAGKLGLGTAYIAGFRYALEHDYDLIFEMDADFSHDPTYLPAFLQAAQEADVVVGSRYVPGGDTPNWSTGRRFISGGGNIYARTILGLPVKDCTAGYKCYSRQVIAALDLDVIHSEGYAFQIEMIYQCHQRGFHFKEIPIIFLDRRVGKSKMSRKIVIEALLYVWRARFSRKRLLTKKRETPESAANVVKVSKQG